MTQTSSLDPRFVRPKVAGLLLVLVVGGCRSALDRQVDAAIAAAVREDRSYGTRFAAERLAQPAWWQGPPIGVPTTNSRALGSQLAASAPLDTVSSTVSSTVPNTAPHVLVVHGRRGNVALEFHGLAPRGGAAALAAWLGEPRIDVAEPVPSSDGSTPPETPAPIAVALEVGPTQLDVDIELEVVSAATGQVDAAAIVARCAIYDVIEAAGVVAPPLVRYHVRSESNGGAAAGGTAGATRVTLRIAAGSKSGQDVAVRAAAAIAARLCDARAAELERYLFTLDGEYQARRIGASTGHVLPPIAKQLETWHLEARAALRALCLDVTGPPPKLDAPTPP